MSYNTRRTSAQGVGRGSQVMYHQQQPRPAGQNRVNQSSPINNQGNFSPTNYQGTNQGFVVSPQQQQQQQPPPAKDQIQTTPTTPPPPPPPPALKAEPLTPTKGQEAMDDSPMKEVTTPDDDIDTVGDPSVEQKPKPWIKKKTLGSKVNKKIKRRRQNARLRKMLQPKNAIMVLNELKAGIKFTFQEHTNALTQTMFIVNAEVDGKTYIGHGLSKPLAKQNAAENALKALLLEKMAEASLKADTDANDAPEPMQTEANNGSGSGDSMEDNESVGDAPPKGNAPEDDVPWGSLASFALYKLFTEWQSQGTHVPIPKPGPVTTPNQVCLPVPSSDQSPKAGAPAPMKKIPDNPTERHPVMLLNQLKPGIQFTEVRREGMPPNLTFTMGVEVDGTTYTGVAKNKKDAKKEAAKAALAGSMNIIYT